MNDKTLTIVIPARNEMFLARTIKDILENSEGETDVIAVLDGQWTGDPIPVDERVTVVLLPESIGQRAATNLAVKLSKSKYIMKVDAHCSFDKGFDRKMMDAMQDNFTMVPTMKNLHAFDWVCPDGHRTYQGAPGPCNPKDDRGKSLGIVCGKPTVMEVVWRAKNSPNSTAFRFDKTLHFQYWSQYKKRQTGDVVDTMTIQGSAFMLTRAKYWELDICSEEFGSWGQQGVEVACKTWLSGGRVVCLRTTWYAHMFRTQEGFKFPYHNPESEIEKNRKLSRELFQNNKWPKAIRTFESLLEQFAPIPDWHDTQTKGIIYYADMLHDPKMLKACQEQLQLAKAHRLVAVTLNKPTEFGKNIVVEGTRGPEMMFKQIITGLEAIDTDIIFLAESDVLYHPSHFDFTPPRKDTFYYNTNVWKVWVKDGFASRVENMKQLSGLCVYRETMIAHMKERLEYIKEYGFTTKMGFEPFTHTRVKWPTQFRAESWESPVPNVCFRHDKNITKSKRSPDEFRDQRHAKGWQESDTVPGWGKTEEILKIIGL